MFFKKEDQDELFKIFRRLDMQNNRTIEGTGLGLAIAHNLISLMDGNLQMTSEYGKGSSFVAVIPQQAVDLKPIGDFRMRHNEGEGRSRYHEKFIAPTATAVAPAIMNSMASSAFAIPPIPITGILTA